ncbi:MAG: sigma-54 dependent transcriptional regulator [Desulforhabdus sp.]|jgi:DNA-binding NtrC family response regulator|nr:sigma-54 dependent transcriptional regulator [Desulforhabdus sp.]
MAKAEKRKHTGAQKRKILCVDRGIELARQITAVFEGGSLQVVPENSLDLVLDRMEDDFFDLLVLSSKAAMRGTRECIELLDVLSAESPATQVLLLIHPGELELAAAAIKTGSYHFAKLPLSGVELKLRIEAALENPTLPENTLLLKKGRREKGFEDMVGASKEMKKIYQFIRQAAVTDIPVLLTGETGTGKDLAAKAIHQLSKRSQKPYTPVHLGALPQDLVAGELFGHEKGAFTGATEKRKGSFELSHQGTVFLDEISTIDERVQISLLRLLETKTLNRIGGSKTIKANIRIIAASNEDLAEAVRRGTFRKDLYYRLEVFQIAMPPLRDRGGDLLLLVDRFLKTYNEEYNKRILGLAPECVAGLQAYDWPGNVREVKNVIHRAVVICSGNVILPEHLPQRVKTGAEASQRIVLPVGTTLAAAEREIIKSTLNAAGGNLRQASRMLGISRGTMYNKIKKHQLSDERP